MADSANDTGEGGQVDEVGLASSAVRRPVTRNSPYTTVEITVSFRLHDVGGPCAFISAIADQPNGQRRLIDSQHFTNAPERLVDLTMDHVRVIALEHFLPLTSPF